LTHLGLSPVDTTTPSTESTISGTGLMFYRSVFNLYSTFKLVE